MKSKAKTKTKTKTKKKIKHGGTRKGAGRKQKYGEQATWITVNMPVTLIHSLDAIAESFGVSRSEVVVRALRSEELQRKGEQ